ncbi:lipase 1-like [Ctenocephalides felis]|uniref:lipase 1-like n=1 Tax=Ctenocephalides felis TaxID=7515 RepID=UPI000E6E552D|nr:lipase 1-like [Ctenocephalides felis]
MQFVPIFFFLGVAVYAQKIDKSDSVTDLITSAGYPAELHNVVTDDGYILSMHRIPNPGKKPIVLMHGLLATSAAFVTIGPKKSLGFMLYNDGYDVWMPNARGTTLSRAHQKLDPDRNPKFWNFSWHEIGILDLPASIDYVLNATENVSLRFIGHSQGTTVFFVLLAEKPEYNKKIITAHLMAPAAYVWNVRSPLIRTLEIFNTPLQRNAVEVGVQEFYPGGARISSLWKRSCQNINQPLYRMFCTRVIYLLGGANAKQFNFEYIRVIQKSFPGGSSAKQFDHFIQLVSSRRFSKFNYGPQKNLQIYKTPEAPEYDFRNITAKIFIYYGDNDYLITPKDVHQTASKIKNLQGMYRVQDRDFSHMDFLWANDCDKLLYTKVMKDLELGKN